MAFLTRSPDHASELLWTFPGIGVSLLQNGRLAEGPNDGFEGMSAKRRDFTEPYQRERRAEHDGPERREDAERQVHTEYAQVGVSLPGCRDQKPAVEEERGHARAKTGT